MGKARLPGCWRTDGDVLERLRAAHESGVPTRDLAVRFGRSTDWVLKHIHVAPSSTDRPDR